LAASFLGDAEFWAKAELAGANAMNARLIARNFFQFIDFLSSLAN
jgi:hypothetical protein